MRIPILSGIYAKGTGDFAVSYPVNRDPVIMDTGISEGFLRAPLGITQIGTGPGADRGGISWLGICYRVMGTKLVSVAADGTPTVLGGVGDGGPCGFDYSFDNLIVNSGDRLYYYNATDGFRQLSDIDLGPVRDTIYVDGYTMTTDGASIVVTELNDPMSVNPLKYGSSEEDPDPITGLFHMHGEVYAMNANTIQIFQNIGGNGFPFQTVKSATIPYGCCGPRAKCAFIGTIAFIGSQRNAAPGVYLAGAGDADKISAKDVDDDIASLSDDDLFDVWAESRNESDEQRLYVHLPSRTWVFHAQASKTAGIKIWTSYDNNGSAYNGRGLVYCYGMWIVGDALGRIGRLDTSVSTRYGESVDWLFDTKMLYNEANRAILTGLDLVGTPGHGDADARVFFSYTKDGETWSMERATPAGRQGQRTKRVAWRPGVRFEQYMGLRFRGKDAGGMSIARLEADIEPLA